LEREEITKSDNQASAQRAYEAAAPQRAQAAREQAEWVRSRTKEILTDSSVTADIQFKPYDGRFATAQEVQDGITNAFDTFLEQNSTNDVQRKQLIMILDMRPSGSADLSLVETWRTAWDFFQEYITPQVAPTLESAPAEAPAPVAEVPQEAVNPYKFGSREYENFDREQYRAAVLSEKLKGDDYQNALATIQNDAGKTLSGADQIKFLNWYSLPAQRRRFPSMEYFRLGFCEFFNAPETLNDADRELMAYNLQVNSMTSDDVKKLVGSRNSYDPSNDAYRVGRS
jgi:hypothetical protein